MSVADNVTDVFSDDRAKGCTNLVTDYSSHDATLQPWEQIWINILKFKKTTKGQTAGARNVALSWEPMRKGLQSDVTASGTFYRHFVEPWSFRVFFIFILHVLIINYHHLRSSASDFCCFLLFTLITSLSLQTIRKDINIKFKLWETRLDSHKKWFSNFKNIWCFWKSIDLSEK